MCITIDENITLGDNGLSEDISVNIIDQQTNVSENENLGSDILNVATDPPDEGNKYIIWLYYNNFYSNYQLNASFVKSYIYL